MEQTIACPQGCAPGAVHLGTTAKTLRFTFTPTGGGEITGVQGLSDPPFSNGRRSGSDFLIDYGGAAGGQQSWPYSVISDPPCPDKSQPQLTNGPG